MRPGFGKLALVGEQGTNVVQRAGDRRMLRAKPFAAQIKCFGPELLGLSISLLPLQYRSEVIQHIVAKSVCLLPTEQEGGPVTLLCLGVLALRRQDAPKDVQIFRASGMVVARQPFLARESPAD